MTQNVDNIIPQIIMITRQQRLWLLLLFTVFFRVIAEGGPTIRGNVYGGGNLADVKTNTAVNMSAGAVEGNVYGGGKGTGENSFTCDKAMVGTEEAANACIDPASADYKDKGTKVTISNGTVGTLDGEDNLVEGTGNVYGGGEVGRVEWNTQVIIGVGTGGGTFAPVILGNVFGAGMGLETHVYSALVRGNSTVTVGGSAKIGYNVYGGGENSTVGRYWVKDIPTTACEGETEPTAPTDLPDGMPYLQRKGGICSVTIQGNAVIGESGVDDKGHVFGAGKGVEPHFVASGGEGASQKMVKGDMENPDRLVDFTDNATTGQTAEEAYLEFLQTLSLVTNTYVTIDGSAQVKGSVFGGSESGFVQTNTNVEIKGSGCVIGTTTYGNVFGGGKGLETFAEAGKVKGNTTVTINDGTIKGNVYGGGRLGDVGIIDKTEKDTYNQLTYNYYWKQTGGTTANVANHNTNATAANTGICTVNISGGTIGIDQPDDATKHGNVFGAGRGSSTTWWCEKAIAYATNVSISAGTVNGNVYGGGQIGRVEDDTKVVIGTTGTPASGTEGEEGYVAPVPATGPTITGNVFGAGAGLQTHGYSALVRGNAAVTVQGTAQIGGSVYGGGEIASVGKFHVVGGLPTTPDSGGTCIVNIKDNATIGTSGTGHNVYGACKGVTPAYVASGDNRSKSMQLSTNVPEDGNLWSVYKDEDGNEDNRFIWRYYASEADYLAFLKTLALTSNPHVTIGGTWTPNETTGTITASGTPSVFGSVYGGGQRGVTLGAVDVNMVGGTVEQDVYGGGALADTNLGNWDVNGYVEATGLTAGTSSVTGLYTRTESEGKYTYTKITDESATAESGTTYYRQEATWAHTEGSAYYKTTVDLTGGTIKGDAYGGGLGQKTGFYDAQNEIAAKDIEAVVWGDINVTLGSNGGSSATSFYTTYDNAGTSETPVQVIKSGRVFGCNNLLGSPQGDVTVTVWRTVAGNGGTQVRTTAAVKAANKAIMDAHPDDYESVSGYVTPTYEVAAVYGGGNLAPYEAAGKKAHVIINGCDLTSILTVYGGGNAAPVPETAVDVNSCYEIGSVFGGGNGKDKYKIGTTWTINPGANVNGNANTMIYGGTVHEAYGGSNKKGTITGNVTIDVGDNIAGDTCPLDVAKVVGAGKNADVEGDLIVIMGCKPSTKVPLLFAGADNANVNGNVELTITSGNFGKVFGGNNQGGAILGHIKLNIEETGSCDTPITIDELYLGGNEAAYSQYGYYLDTDGETYLPRTETMAALSASDEGYITPASGRISVPYAAPELNIVSCTYIGQVFGGGYGAGATIYGNPQVNINMIQGSKHSGVPTFMTTDSRLAALHLSASENPNELGIIGTVYGGGNAANVEGNPMVNIGTASTVQCHEEIQSISDAGVATYQMSTAQNVLGAYITGNVYGGGKGEADNFFCDKAMIGKDGDGIANPNGGTTVNIYKGLVRGNVYGGGQIGRVEKNTAVTIGTGNGVATGTPTSAPIIMGSVFGGGAGEEEHGYAALVRGNPTVTIQGNAKVRHNVYGGGEIASVARYNVPRTEAAVQQAIAEGYTDAVLGMPYALKDESSGSCKVIVQGYAEIGTDGMKMYHTDNEGNIVDNDKPDDWGHVFGAGKGILPGGDYAYANGTTRRMVLYDAKDHTSATQGTKWQWVDPDHSETNKNVWEYFGDLDEYIRFIQTLALSSRTDVTITGNAFVKGSVYGGSENGIVQFNTDVKIQGGQIGCGVGESEAHTDDYWTTNSEDPTKFAECAHWLFQEPYAPYDPYATTLYDGKYYYDTSHTQEAAGGAVVATDGHTYYGNVFGGGSGSVPYFTNGQSVYLHSAGQVKGNTNVTISGGHILTNVYGGCETTNVDGTANVTMTGGTVGVPRTDEQIIAHPLTGYIFGGGKGDQRVFFNKDTNVNDAEVTVEGGRVYGSVYGGGEDGHVMRNVTLTIGKKTTTGEGDEAVTTTSGPKIGTKGTSYYDGHVFGGGRGFGGDALTAGNVGGSVDVNILDGEILGSVYGGGRLASVGYGLYLTSETGYGEMRADDQYDGSYTNPSTEDAKDFFTKGRGHTNITISGGTIGNDHEYTYDASNQISHTKGGNVFAGGMGRMYKLDGTTAISSLDWRKLGCVKSTKLKITGGTINSCVYGGGELGQVVGYRTVNGDNLSTNITIEGSNTKIGTEVKDGEVIKYTFGSVYGSGYGSLIEEITYNGTKTNPKFEAGLVKYDTKIDMKDGKVLASIYGGGEVASVGFSTNTGESFTVQGNNKEGETITTTVQKTTVVGSTHVSVSGGSIGKSGFGGAKMGNVYGGGSGHPNAVRTGKVFKNANVSISGTPIIYHNIYGGGAYGTVGDFGYVEGNENVDVNGETVTVKKVFGVAGVRDATSGVATVTITGGTIGVDGHDNGMVFGSSRGDINAPWERDDHTAWVNTANVTIGTAATGTQGQEGYVAASGPRIKGSVYGSGENGHTFNNTVVTVNGGTIGIESGAPVTSNGVEYSGAAYPYRGNVYGGGCGTDMYDSDSDGTEDSFNALAGVVYGTTTVNINGGKVVRNVYGAGAMGSVGKTVTIDGVTTVTGGSTQVNISGGIIGVNGNDNGNVFGSARGSEGISTSLANVITSEVNIKPGANVWGSVYGGGEAGFVKGNVAVNMLGGLVKHDVYGGGALADTNISNWGGSTWATGMYNSTTHATTYHTNVSLKGGTVGNNVYGGGLGRKAATGVSAVEAKVYGDVLVKLNEPTISEGSPTYGNCVVQGKIFGCNNLNGSPQSAVTVHIHKTQGWTEGTGDSAVSHDVSAGKNDATVAKGTGVYEVAAVYGGGNLAAFKPDLTATADTAVACVIIDGCDLTSIETVYGGGNAASVPATEVTVNGTYEIGEVFGGGNGKDDVSYDGGTTYVTNPGANVGYLAYTSDSEKASKAYGTGKAHATIYGGTVHAVYGGSNTKGNVRVESRTTLEDAEECTFNVGEAYGGGHNAPQDGDAILEIGCISGLAKACGGAAEADVNGNVVLNITNGTYGQVFGGNDLGGAIRGSITVNIEETGCRPVIIGELYGGGNKAAYSVFGYDASGNVLTSGSRVADPQVNVHSFTSIGNVFGGGYGEEAVMVGDPHVNINVTKGKYAETYNSSDNVVADNRTVYDLYPVPSHAKGAIGAINNVFGGGNAAKVIGTPHVNVGTEVGDEVYEPVTATLTVGTTSVADYYTVAKATGTAVEGTTYYEKIGGRYSPVTATLTVGSTSVADYYTVTAATGTAVANTTYYEKKTVAVDIRGNVFGGGNNAEVEGDTDVVVGKRK